MPKVMLINVTHSEESRVGILNDRVLESFEIESLSRTHLKGNIYKGVVHRIHPALEAAFVDIGAERDAFLPLDEICFNNLEGDPKGGARNGSSGGRSQLRIRDVLRAGQEVLVQITKEQFANKPPTVSTFYSLPGRYLVLLPGSEDTGISRRIEGEERDRLRKVVDDIKPESGFGLIVRTVAGLEDTGGELSRDLNYLQRLWTNVKEASSGRPAPSLVYREHDIVQRAIRDFYTPDITEIYIDDEDVYQRAREFLRAIMPGSEAVLRLYRGEQPLFSAFSVEAQIESVFGRRVRLPSGGSIVIDGTEALTAIDVNSGGAVRGANPEETAFRTNQEAASEVARQLRLRDIGGIIVVDFIDMRDPRHNREIEQLMRDEMRLDKARHETGRLSSLGLMQISRQRLRPAAGASSHTTCPLCQGYGSVRTHGSAALGAIRKIHDRLSLGDVESMVVTLPTEVGLFVLNQKREDLANLESRYESAVEVRLSIDMLPHEIETEVKERSRTTSKAKAVEHGGVVEPTSPPKPSRERSTSERSGDDAGNGNGKRRRRRRKRGGSRSAGENGAESTESSTSQGGDDAATSSGESAERPPRQDTQQGSDRRQDNSKDRRDDARTETSGEATNGAGADASTSSETGAASGNESAGKQEEGSPNPRSRRSRGRRGGRRRRGGGQGSSATDGDSGARASSAPTGSDGERSSRPESASRQSSPREETGRDEQRPVARPASNRESGSRESGERHRPAAAATPSPGAPAASAGSSSAEKPFTAEKPAAADKPAAAEKPAAAKRATRKTAPAAKADTKPKRAAAKKTTTKKAAAKKTTTKKAAAKKTTTKKAAAKKTATKTTAKKATTKKAAAKKVAASDSE